MTDRDKADHWAELTSVLGAEVAPEEKQPEPAPVVPEVHDESAEGAFEPTPAPATIPVAPKTVAAKPAAPAPRRPAASNWDQLASELGVEATIPPPQPSKPHYEKPAKAAYEKPSKPAFEKPAKPAFQKPAKPVYEEPVVQEEVIQADVEEVEESLTSYAGEEFSQVAEEVAAYEEAPEEEFAAPIEGEAAESTELEQAPSEQGERKPGRRRRKRRRRSRDTGAAPAEPVSPAESFGPEETFGPAESFGPEATQEPVYSDEFGVFPAEEVAAELPEAEVPETEEQEAEPKARRPRRRRRRGSGRQREAAAREQGTEEPQPTEAVEGFAEGISEEPIEDTEMVMSGESDFDDEDHEGGDDESPRAGFRNIPTWSEAIGVIVGKNMESRAKNPAGSRSHGGGRGRGGNRGGGRRRSPEKRD